MKKITLYIAFFLLPLFLYAQPYLHYTTEQGLPSNHVYQIEQDHDGFIWFATNMGLSKFDGKTFKNFSTKDGLPTNDIWRIEATEDGRLWYFAKSKRLGYIQDEKVYAYSTESEKNVAIYSIIHNKKSIDFIGMIGYESSEYKLIGEKWKAFYTIPKETLVKEYLYNILSSEKNKIDIVKPEKQLIDSSGHVVFHFLYTKNTKTMIDSLLGKVSRKSYYKYDSIYFAVNENYLLAFNFSDKRIDGLSFSEKFNTTCKIIPEIQPYKNNYQASINNLWIEFDKKLNIIDSINIPSTPTPIQIYKDDQKNVWKAGHDFGAYTHPRTAIRNNYLFLNEKIQTINIVSSSHKCNFLS